MPTRRRRAANAVEAGSVPPPKPEPVKLPTGWKHASDVLDKVTAVRTIFPDFNLGSRVGGLPVRRIATITGKSAGGKSAFAIGLLRSFLMGGHYAGLVDAEHATGSEFVSELVGELAQYPSFFAKRPDTYEDTIDSVDEFLGHVAAQRKNGHSGKCSILVVDSITKLVPKHELDAILKEGGEAVSKGRSGQRRAAVNQAWLDHLVPRLSAANCALVLVAQERASDDDFAKVGEDFKIKGGQALLFDASMVIRISKAMPMRDPPSKEGEIVGFQHRIRIHKSKVGHLDGRWTDAAFHLSNGKLSPPGFDLARDCLAAGRKIGVVSAAGSWISWNRRRWQGEAKAVAWLSKPQNDHALRELADMIAKACSSRAPEVAER